jgi:transcriptional regulator with XRE-family HTH domain
MIFASNLKFLRKRKAVSQQGLSDLLGISRGSLGHYETGKVKNIPHEELISISDYFCIPVDVLLKVDTSQLPEAVLNDIESNKAVYSGMNMRVIVTTVDSEKRENIEYVPLKAKAGYLRGLNDPDYISHLPVFNLPHLPRDRKYRMFPTEGDSMLPFPEKAMIIAEFIDDWYSIKDDELCIVVTMNDGIVFKQVQNRLKADQAFILKSLNPVYKPYIVPGKEVLEIWKYHNYLSDVSPTGDISLLHLAEDIRSVKSDVNRILSRMIG